MKYMLTFFLLTFSCAALAQHKDSLIVMNHENLNTSANEVNPFLSPDGKTFYFMRRVGSNTSHFIRGDDRLMQCTIRDDGYLMEPEEVSALSKLVHFSNVSCDDAGDLFLSYRREGEKSNEEGIYSLIGNNMAAIPELKAPLQFDGSPSISADGKTIVFVSTRAMEKNHAYNIYISHRSDRNSTWSPPVRLGPEINMAISNLYPYLSRDGKRLFFSSNPEHEWLQIYMSMRTGDSDTSWSKPVKLPDPINGHKNCVYPYLSTSGKQFYFSSDRVGGKGGYDIYEVSLPDGIDDLIATH